MLERRAVGLGSIGFFVIGFFFIGFLGGVAPAIAGELKLAIANGRVTLVAKDVPLRQILAEWSRVGQTRIVNGEKVAGAPLTLQLLDVPERQALEVLLRSVSGYLAAPRPVAVTASTVSQYDRIMILPGTPPPVSTTVGRPGAPPFNRTPPPARAMPVQPQDEEVIDEEEVDEDEEVEDADDEELTNEDLSEDEIDNEERQVPVQPLAPVGVARPGQPVVSPGTSPTDPTQPPLTAPRPGQVVAPPPQPPPFRVRQPPQNPPE
jgi:hypothetical protein